MSRVASTIDIDIGSNSGVETNSSSGIVDGCIVCSLRRLRRIG